MLEIASTGHCGPVWPPGVAKTSLRPKTYIANISRKKQEMEPLKVNRKSYRLVVICSGRRYRLIIGKNRNGHRRGHIVFSSSERQRLLQACTFFGGNSLTRLIGHGCVLRAISVDSSNNYRQHGRRQKV